MHQNNIFVVGGIVEDENGQQKSTRIVEKYDLTTRIWARGPELVTARDSPGIASINDQLFVGGGRNCQLEKASRNSGKFANVEVLKEHNDNWILLTEDHLKLNHFDQEYTLAVLDRN